MQGIQVEFYTWHAVIGDRQAISVYPCRRLAATHCFVTLRYIHSFWTFSKTWINFQKNFQFVGVPGELPTKLGGS